MIRAIWLAVVTLVAVSGFGGMTPAQAQKTTHHTFQRAVSGSASCSATAIAPQAILTASHCEVPTDAIEIDGTDATIVKRIRDENDHTIYLIQGIKFTDWAGISTANEFTAGERVYIFGNPAELRDVYREGYMAAVAKYSQEDPTPVFYYDMNNWFGDSGAGIFNQDGNVVAVISFGRSGDTIRLEGSLVLGYTSEQIDEARAFTAPVAKSSARDIVNDIIKALGSKR